MFVKLDVTRDDGDRSVWLSIAHIIRVEYGTGRFANVHTSDGRWAVRHTASDVADLISRALYDHERSMSEARESVRW